MFREGDTVVIRDDHGRIVGREDALPVGVTKNLSSNAQVLAAAGKKGHPG